MNKNELIKKLQFFSLNLKPNIKYQNYTYSVLMPEMKIQTKVILT